MVKNNQISSRQVMRLVTFDLLGYSALMLPQALAKTAGRDGIFGIVLGVVAGFLYLQVLQAVMKKMECDYLTYLDTVLGKIGGAIFKFCYGVYFLLLAGRILCIFAELVVSELLEKQFHLILILLLVLIYYGISGGIEGRARVFEILFWIVLIPLTLMMLAAVPSVDTDYWTPIFYGEAKLVLKSGYQVFQAFSILFLLPFLAEYLPPRAKRQEDIQGAAHTKCRKSYYAGKVALFLVGGILAALYLILLGMFGSDALATMDYPVVTMMSRIQITGGFLKRVDALMFGIWFFTLYALVSSLMFWGSRICQSYVKGHSNCMTVLVVVAVFFVAEGFYFQEGMVRFWEQLFFYVGTPFVVLVPVLLLLLSKKKGGHALCSPEGSHFASQNKGGQS